MVSRDYETPQDSVFCCTNATCSTKLMTHTCIRPCFSGLTRNRQNPKGKDCIHSSHSGFLPLEVVVRCIEVEEKDR